MHVLRVKNLSVFLVTENLNFCSVAKLSKIHPTSLYSLQSFSLRSLVVFKLFEGTRKSEKPQ